MASPEISGKYKIDNFNMHSQPYRSSVHGMFFILNQFIIFQNLSSLRNKISGFFCHGKFSGYYGHFVTCRLLTECFQS